MSKKTIPTDGISVLQAARQLDLPVSTMYQRLKNNAGGIVTKGLAHYVAGHWVISPKYANNSANSDRLKRGVKPRQNRHKLVTAKPIENTVTVVDEKV